MTRVRVATIEDLDELAAMVTAFLEETAYRHVTTGEPDQIRQTLASLITGQGRVFIADDDGGAVGCIAVLVYRHPVSGGLVGSELIWWVHPDARATRAGHRLLRAAEQWATDHDATQMQCVAWRGRLEGFYRRLGYQEMETVYIKDLPCHSEPPPSLDSR